MYSDIILEMIKINSGDNRRINHALKVFALTMTIAETEIDQINKRVTAIISSILHDIGIQKSIEKYGKSTGKYQEVEGPPIAKEILSSLGYEKKIIDRVCYLISKHHTYNEIIDIDLNVLIEADFLVNLDEDKSSIDAILNAKEKIFKTEKGLELLDEMLLSDKFKIDTQS